MQLTLPLAQPPASGRSLTLPGGRSIPLRLARNRRARRYILRLGKDGVAQLTIPRGGVVDAAMIFARRQSKWLERQWHRLEISRRQAAGWADGTQVLLRGELATLRVDRAASVLQFAGHRWPLPAHEGDLRKLVETHLRRIALTELPVRAWELARLHALPMKRVVLRNQRSRWGSASVRGTVSLNWRLIQAPPHVRDYMLFHELVHLRHMNHSHAYWAMVESLCPDYAAAEAWLRRHDRLLSGAPA